LNNKLKVLDLFSGIGGFSLGLHSTGIFDTIKFVEFDKYCQKVLNKNFPNIPIEGDIRNVKGTEFEADVITGGFPCQPFSVAGKQKGTNDNRYLWPEMFRLIKEIKPEFVIGENVQGIINLQDGMVLRQVLNDLEGEGFEVQCFLIPASGIGAWHQRNRTWIIGHSKHNGLLASEKRSRDKKINGGTSEGQNQTIESERTSGSTNDGNVSNTNSGLRGRWGTIGESGEDQIWRFRTEEEEQTTHDIRSQTIGCNALSREGEEDVPHSNEIGLQGRSIQSNNMQDGSNADQTSSSSIGQQQTWWEVESSICRIPNGISYELDKDRASRIKTLGNAIVPQIAREIGLAIKKVLNDSSREN
jgi:DNA (cytosine-5)-methyltransferase 1